MRWLSKWIHRNCNIPVDDRVRALEEENKKLREDLACERSFNIVMQKQMKDSLFY